MGDDGDTSGSAAADGRLPKLIPGNLRQHIASAEYLNLTENDGAAIDEYAEPHTWSSCHGSTFYTRIGPDYQVNGLKDTSDNALYEVFACSVYKSRRKVPHFSRFVDFVAAKKLAERQASQSSKNKSEGDSSGGCEEKPEVGEMIGDDTEEKLDFDAFQNLKLNEAEIESLSPEDFYLETGNGEKIPEFFVVNCMIPGYTPSAFSRKEDGDGYNFVLFLRMSAKTKELLKLEDPGPSLRLLKRFILCQPHKDDEDFDPNSPLIRKKFKIIARVMNAAQTNFNRVTKSCVTTYNAKPFLARTSSTFFQGPGYFETGVDIHKFGYPAKLGLAGVRESSRKVVVDFGFVIQAEDNDELPEQMLGCCRIEKMCLSEFEEFPAEILQAYR